MKGENSNLRSNFKEATATQAQCLFCRQPYEGEHNCKPKTNLERIAHACCSQVQKVSSY